MQPRIASDSPDQSRLIWKLFDDGFVGVAPIDTDQEMTTRQAVIGHLVAKHVQAIDSLLRNGSGAALAAVLSLLRSVCVLLWFDRSRCMDEIDGDGATRFPVLVRR